MDFSFLTTPELREQRKAYYDAYTALSSGVKSYMLGSRQITRFDLSEIREELRGLSQELAIREGGAKPRCGRLVPRDG